MNRRPATITEGGGPGDRDPEAGPHEGARLAFLTSLYAKQSHTFMRQEVAGLRALGWDVRTFSIRRPPDSEIVDEDVRREHRATHHILAAGAARLAWATLRECARSPVRFLAALKLAWRVGTPGVSGRLKPLAYVAEAAYLAGRVRSQGIEHIHNHLGRNSASVAMMTSALTGVPYSLTIHGPTEFDEPRALALGEKIRHSSFTVAISEYGRSQLCRWADRGDWPKIRVVRCGLGRDFLDAAIAPLPEAPRLVSVGRLVEQKGQLVLVEAVALLKARGVDFHLEIIGDGPMRGVLERAISEHGLGGNVRLAGLRDSEGVRRAIVESRLMVLPSFAEGLPVVLMESLALGRPVVSTFVAGIPELVRPGREGWLVPAGSAELLAEALAEALAASTEDLRRMGRSGAERVAARHDIDAEVLKLARCIRPEFKGATAHPAAQAPLHPQAT